MAAYLFLFVSLAIDDQIDLILGLRSQPYHLCVWIITVAVTKAVGEHVTGEWQHIYFYLFSLVIDDLIDPLV